MNPSQTAYALLPEWALAFAFIASLALVALQIFKITRESLQESELEVRLTRELFFRIIDRGEALFVNPIYLAKHGNVLIQNAHLVLMKTSGNPKTFQLRVVYLGEKVQETGARMSNLNFFTSSPADLIAKDDPKRSVYLTVLTEYSEKIEAAVRTFHSECTKLKQRIDTSTPITQWENDRQTSFYNEVIGFVNQSAAVVNKLIQVEAGSYELVLKVEYIPLSRKWFRRTKVAESKVQFEVREDVRQIESGVRNMFLETARVRVFDEKIAVIYPEYAPYSVVEVE